MSLSRVVISVLSLTLFANVVFAQNYQQYKLKEGDTISEVLQQKGADPLYGEGKYVQEALKLNRLQKGNEKELNPGDVILLPLDAPANEKVIVKEVKVGDYQTGPVFQGEAFFTYGTRNENVDFGDAKIDSSLWNNFGVKVAADLNRIVKIYGYEISGFASLHLEKLDSASEKDISGGKSSYDYAANFTGGVYINQFDFAVRPFVQWQYEVYNSSDLVNNEITPRSNSISWIGVGFVRNFHPFGKRLEIKPSLNYSLVSSSELENGLDIDGLTGFKTSLSMKLHLTQKWRSALEVNYYNFEQYTNYSMTSASLMFGRRI